MSTLLLGAVSLAFFGPWLATRPRHPFAPTTGRSAWLHASWEVPLLAFHDLTACTETGASVRHLMTRLEAHRGLAQTAEAAMQAVAEYVQLLPGEDDDALGGLWRECLASAGRALDWPACAQIACPRLNEACSRVGALPALAAFLAGLLIPLRNGLRLSVVELCSSQGRHPWIPLLGPMQGNVWGADRYVLQPAARPTGHEPGSPADSCRDRLQLYRRAPAVALDFVLRDSAREALRRDEALQAELLWFLGGERSTRYDHLLTSGERPCTCPLAPDRSLRTPSARMLGPELATPPTA